MTLEPGAATTEAAQSPPTDARFASFNELRTAHLDLRSSYSETVSADGAPDPATLLRQFLTRAQKTGAILLDPSVRKAAQGILDYWSAELAGIPDAKSDDFVPFILAPPEISTLSAVEQTPSEGDAPTQRQVDQRVLIRLSGTARQWRNSDKQAGYLLAGEALEQARPFAEKDPDLADFIKASEDAEHAIKRRRRTIAYAAFTVLGVFVLGAVLFVWQFYTLPQTSKSWIHEIKGTTSGKTQTADLWWLATFQPWLPPYDFSGTPKLANIGYPGLRLNAPNFSGVELSKVRLPKSQLPSASFNGAAVDIDTEDKDPDWKNVTWNDFSNAELKLAQFRASQIIATSFYGADLYRAVFDRALLCDVNFSYSDLQKTSFWGATLDDRTYGWLRKTAWWVAVGWNSSDFEKLLNPQGQNQPNQIAVNPQAAAAEAKALRQTLRTSDRFHTDVEGPLAEARPGTFGRALALNDLAWTLTTWGIDPENVRTTPTPCDANAEPKEAFDAASEAICIVEDLKSKGGQDKDYDYWLSGFRDTQAYILMQADRMAEARALYEKDLPRTEADNGMLFRYAIVLFALGEEAEATKRVDAAIHDKQYLPSDELQNLKRYIPPSVRQMAYEVIDMTYPAPKPVQTCPAATKAN
jgi:Pentapeptide repeats (8 copies)